MVNGETALITGHVHHMRRTVIPFCTMATFGCSEKTKLTYPGNDTHQASGATGKSGGESATTNPTSASDTLVHCFS